MFNLKQQNAKNTVINELLVIFKDILTPFSKTIFLDLITKDSIFYMFYVNRYLNLFPSGWKFQSSFEDSQINQFLSTSTSPRYEMINIFHSLGLSSVFDPAN